MTVCTNDVALGDLVEDVAPIAIANAFGELEALVAEVVELKHDRIALTAVDARVVAEEMDQIFGPLGDHGSLPELCVGDVALPVRRVVFLLVRGATRAAVVVALAPCATAPREVLQRPLSSAAST
jgi:hypothetical protein